MFTQKSTLDAKRFNQLSHYEMNQIKGGDDPTPPPPPPIGSGGGGDDH
jgi:hypothetical protein